MSDLKKVMEIQNIKLNKTCREVLKKCGKTEKDVKEAVEILMEWRRKQPHLPDVPLDEIYYRRIAGRILNCKFNLERVKKGMDKYYSIRNVIPELFENWDPLSEEIQRAGRIGGFLILPELTKDLCKVVILSIRDPNLEDFDPCECMKLGLLFSEMRARKEFTNGEHYIVDFEHLKFSHITKYTPAILKKFYDVMMNAYALRLSGVHFINSKHLNTILSLLKPLLNPKIYDRIVVHENLSSLHKIISKSVLPKDYGGSLATFDKLYEKQIEELRNMRSVFIDEIKYKTDESKRLNFSDTEYFGSIHGTFRKLTVD